MKIKHMLLYVLDVILFIAYSECRRADSGSRLQNYDVGIPQKQGYVGLGYGTKEIVPVKEFYKFG